MRDDFSVDVKRSIAARVGNLCSNPSCRAPTSGPQSDSTKALNIGVAAHITAASEGGPRYNRSLSPEERRRSDNAIWLCQNCAKLVDNDAARFSEEMLRRWKQEAENEAKERIGKTRPTTHGHEQLGEKPEDYAFWNVPYPRNLLFTGREDILGILHAALGSKRTVALSGLGGVGKTFLAVEYSYRYKADYGAVLWIKADTHEVLVSSFAALAGVLRLPQAEIRQQNLTIDTVINWLRSNSDWLLIFDNADDLRLVRGFIPSGAQGQVLLTTQASSTGEIAHNIRVEKLESEDGALLLLRRAKAIAGDDSLDKATVAEQEKALEIAEAVGGLPLALDQAGAYIDETQSSLEEYLERYEIQGAELRRQRGEFVMGHPESVSITFWLSFHKAATANPTTAGLLSICSFLHPDAIPEELFSEGAKHLNDSLAIFTTDQLEFSSALKEACRFSLLRRDPNTKTLSIHRLVQDVLKDHMKRDTQATLAKITVHAVSIAFPPPEFHAWRRCERLLPHALACARLIDEWKLFFNGAAQFLNDVGDYLFESGRLNDAEPLLRRSLSLYEETVGAGHPHFVNTLNNLAILCRQRGNYAEAETLCRRALTALEVMNEPPEMVQPLVALSLHNLASLYDDLGKYEEAEPLFVRALEIRRRFLEEGDRQIGQSLNSLAELYRKLARYDDALPLCKQALSINRKFLGDKHPGVANNLNNLGTLLAQQGNLGEAEQYLRQSLVMKEELYGSSHIDLASTLSNLAEICRITGNAAEAEELLLRALAIEEALLGTDHKFTAMTLHNLAVLYKEQGRHDEAETAYLRALEIVESTVGSEHPDVALICSNLGDLYFDKQDYHRAGELLTRAIQIGTKVLGENHPSVQTMRINQGALLLRIIEQSAKRQGLRIEVLKPTPDQVKRDSKTEKTK